MTSTTSQWPLKQLKNITSKIGSGATPRGGKNGYRAEGISLIRSLNVYDFAFTEENLAFIGDEQAAELNNVIVQKEDILLNITGASVARCCLANPKFLPARVNQHVAIVRVRPEVADARFVLYCINSMHFKSRLLALAQGGATREALTKTTIEDFEVCQPRLSVQRQIAGILSAYDELMENSQWRIRILEKMARSLYREWFVQFRFPGHEKVPLEDSPLGKIPKGWKPSCFGEAADFENGDRGKNYPNGSDFVDEGVPFINAGHLADGAVDLSQVNRITESKYEQLRSGKIREGDLLFCLRGSPGRIARVGRMRNGAIASSLVIIRPTARANKEFLFQTLSSEQGQQMVAELNNGAAQPNVSVGSIQKYPLLLPPKDILNKFAAHVEQNWTLIDTLRAKIQNLRLTRDLLMPRLLSGQVKLGAMENTKVKSP